MDIRFSCLRLNVDLGHYPIIEEEFSPKMIMYQLIQPMTRMIGLILVAILILIGSRVEAKPIEFVFTCWGAPFERQAVKKVLQQFNQQDPNIRVRPQHVHIPNSNYIRPS